MIEDPTSFETFEEYFGPVARTVDETDGGRRTSTIYGFENFSDPAGCFSTIPGPGSVYGVISAGSVTIHDRHTETSGTLLKWGRWFSLPAPVSFELGRFTRVVAVHVAEYHALRSFGGPVETAGRLQYIDGCSDSLIAAPALLGDPCLNLLHFPPGIDQTMHTHPSVRCGAIIGGAGYCEDGAGERKPLRPGMIWMIPAEYHHAFHTTTESLDVIAYHPDSDFGPTHEQHPMLNRTIIDGAKAKSQAATDLIYGYGNI